MRVTVYTCSAVIPPVLLSEHPLTQLNTRHFIKWSGLIMQKLGVKCNNNRIIQHAKEINIQAEGNAIISWIWSSLMQSSWFSKNNFRAINSIGALWFRVHLMIFPGFFWMYYSRRSLFFQHKTISLLFRDDNFPCDCSNNVIASYMMTSNTAFARFSRPVTATS